MNRSNWRAPQLEPVVSEQPDSVPFVHKAFKQSVKDHESEVAEADLPRSEPRVRPRHDELYGLD